MTIITEKNRMNNLSKGHLMERNIFNYLPSFIQRRLARHFTIFDWHSHQSVHWMCSLALFCRLIFLRLLSCSIIRIEEFTLTLSQSSTETPFNTIHSSCGTCFTNLKFRCANGIRGTLFRFAIAMTFINLSCPSFYPLFAAALLAVLVDLSIHSFFWFFLMNLCLFFVWIVRAERNVCECAWTFFPIERKVSIKHQFIIHHFTEHCKKMSISCFQSYS